MDVETRLQQIAEKFGRDLDDVQEAYEATLDDIASQGRMNGNQELLQKTALHVVTGDITREESIGGGEMVELIAIGAALKYWNLRDENGDVVKKDGQNVKKEVVNANALIKDGEDFRLAALILDETNGVDIGKVMEQFKPFNVLKGKVRKNKSEKYPGYIINSVQDTEFEEVEEGGLADMSVEERHAAVLDTVDTASFATILDDLSMTENTQAGEFPVEFGIDVKVINGRIADYYYNDEKELYNYTIVDSEITEPDDLEGTIFSDENKRTNGLTCWTDQSKMEYGVGTMGDFYHYGTTGNRTVDAGTPTGYRGTRGSRKRYVRKDCIDGRV